MYLCLGRVEMQRGLLILQLHEAWVIKFKYTFEHVVTTLRGLVCRQRTRCDGTLKTV